MIPRLVFGTGLLPLYYDFHVRCGYCPLPHKVTLCASHGRMFVASIPEFYMAADEEPACKLCELTSEMIKAHGHDKEVLNRILNDLDSLLTAALGFQVKGGTNGPTA